MENRLLELNKPDVDSAAPEVERVELTKLRDKASTDNWNEERLILNIYFSSNFTSKR